MRRRLLQGRVQRDQQKLADCASRLRTGRTRGNRVLALTPERPFDSTTPGLSEAAEASSSGVATLVADMPKYEAALRAIDDAHSQDPRKVEVDSEQVPYELHYARRMSGFLDRLRPDASPTLRLAIRAQHFRRWEVPRGSYAMNRQGYHSWRTAPKQRQAEQATRICLGCGYDPSEAERVGELIRKEKMRSDDEAQTLEDVACLVFLADQLDQFERAFEEEKMLSILRKTWAKMSDLARELALQLAMPDRARELVAKAVAPN